MVGERGHSKKLIIKHVSPVGMKQTVQDRGNVKCPVTTLRIQMGPIDEPAAVHLVLLHVLPAAQHEGQGPRLVKFETRMDDVGLVQEADRFRFLKVVVASERGHEGGIGYPAVHASETVGEHGEQRIRHDRRTRGVVVSYPDVSPEPASDLPTYLFCWMLAA